ncbi:MAG TPA: peptide chain release factor N(5)-glutamine methyltransferase [Thermomicrobiales bacterium]
MRATPDTFADAIGRAANLFAGSGSPSPRLDAEVLLCHVLGLDRTQLFVRLREPLSPQDLARFAELIERRRTGEPVAYLTGKREFMGLPFMVGPGVLIPRPETEVIVEWALGWLRGRPPATVVDVGTGSGAIALSIAAMRRGSGDRVIAVDRSEPAIGYATANRERLGLVDTVQLVRGDLVTWCAGPVDLVLANLPYLRPEQRAGNADLHAEPEMALVSGDDGLAAIRRLLADAPRILAPGGAIALEIDPSQVVAVRKMARAALPESRIDVLQDLAGLDRVVVADRSTRP